MKKSDRKAAIAQFKSRPIRHGICVVRCTATGETWVAATTQPSVNQNSVWFQLRHGASRNRKMQAAWNAHGEQAFVYEIVETFDDGLSPHSLELAVKERLPYWMAELHAAAIL
jgi:hypothetical protein